MTAERATDAAFAALIALTGASFVAAGSIGRGAMVPVLALAGVKAWLVGERFMDLARAHAAVRVGFAVLVAAIVGAVVVTARVA